MKTAAFTMMPASPLLRLVLSGVAWIASYLAAAYVLDMRYVAPPLDLVVASVPVAAFFVFAWTVQASFRGADELQRRILLEALAMAFLIATMAIMFLGLVEDTPRGHLWVPLRHLGLAMLPLYAACYAAASHHYR